ncbi:gamma-glutamylcyclotransferase family protein [Alicyclobacillus shizuokensis]|uniref:gamma-glutamylcyclotransferase family protein n=1 Tax=Alicyclobacillus shizuokensis TaxID=392014 RepID=UPI000831B73F|nr:gamma-glutamylcyclotransferase family protein [Alicyclobacillus shizuokensis]
MLVFVYGTLREHEQNHHLLAGSKIVARQARVRGRLYDTGEGYPALLEDPEAWTHGEVYDVSAAVLLRLDELEEYHGPGEDNLYNRVLMPVQTDAGEMAAQVYVYADASAAAGFPEVAGGDWRAARVREGGVSKL